MAMKDTLGVLNRMIFDRIIARYAIGGAVAAYYYIEASSTDDLDVLVSFDGFETSSRSGLVTLGPIIEYLSAKGYPEWRNEGIVVEGWPVQFLPVSNDLSAEALEQAVSVDLEFSPGQGSISTLVLSAEHVMSIALETGRAKDLIRIHQFIETGPFDMDRLCAILQGHGLMDKWASFCDKFAVENSCARPRVP